MRPAREYVSRHARCFTARHRTYPILDADNHKRVPIVVDELGHILRPVAIAVASAVNPHEDGELLGVFGRPDVQEETVLAAPWQSGSPRRQDGGTCRAERVSYGCRPVRGGLHCLLPPQVSYRGSRVSNAAIVSVLRS